MWSGSSKKNAFSIFQQTVFLVLLNFNKFELLFSLAFTFNLQYPSLGPKITGLPWRLLLMGHRRTEPGSWFRAETRRSVPILTHINHVGFME